MINRVHLQNIDWVLIGLLLLNSVLGVFVIYSSTQYLSGNYYLRQIVWIAVSTVVLFLFLSLDYKLLMAYAVYFYAGIVAVLCWMLFFGPSIAGTKSWIKLFFFQIQPAELTKIVLLLVLAGFFSEHRQKHLSWKKSLSGLGIFAIPVVLIALQPDMGTALSLLPLLGAAFILAGLKKKAFLFLVILSVILGTFAGLFMLKDYQKQRLETLVSPSKDPLGSGYQIMQSKIAIGSGGLFGKGYTKGTQSQLRFLPARHTDFIFSVAGEEFGFVGIVAGTLLFFIFLSRLFQSVPKARDRTGVYIVFIVSVMMTCQFLANAFMTLGFFPVVGIPIPLWSYGGSSLLTNFIAVSLVLNVKMRRFANV